MPPRVEVSSREGLQVLRLPVVRPPNYPCAGTPLEKTTRPLTSWFYAMYRMTTVRNGVSAKELGRPVACFVSRESHFAFLDSRLTAHDSVFLALYASNSGPREAEKILSSALLPPASGTRKLGWA